MPNIWAVCSMSCTQKLSLNILAKKLLLEASRLHVNVGEIDHWVSTSPKALTMLQGFNRQSISSSSFWSVLASLYNWTTHLVPRYVDYIGSALFCFSKSKSKQTIWIRVGLDRKQIVNKYIFFLKWSCLILWV